MRTRATLGLVLAGSIVLSAQNRVTHLEASCVQTETPAVWAIHPSARGIGWCLNNELRGDETFRLLGDAWAVDLSDTRCSGNACRASLPVEVFEDLAARGRISLRLSVRNVNGESAPSEALQAGTPAAMCRYVPPGQPETTRPLDTAIGGTITATLQATAERVGMFRRDGWRVEWQWDPNARNLIVMMWCVGTPQ